MFAGDAIGEKLIFAVSTGTPGRSFVFRTNAIVIVTGREIDTESLNLSSIDEQRECIEYGGFLPMIERRGQKTWNFRKHKSVQCILWDLLVHLY